MGFECDCCKIRLELGWGEIPGEEQETNGQGTCAQQPHPCNARGAPSPARAHGAHTGCKNKEKEGKQEHGKFTDTRGKGREITRKKGEKGGKETADLEKSGKHACNSRSGSFPEERAPKKRRRPFPSAAMATRRLWRRGGPLHFRTSSSATTPPPPCLPP